MMTNMRRYFVSAGSVFCLLVSGLSASAFIIDTFDAPVDEVVRTTVAVDPTANGWFTPGIGTIVGGERDITVTRLAGAAATDAVRAQVLQDYGTLDYLERTSGGNRRGELYVTWDGGDHSAALSQFGLGGVDATENPFDARFLIDVNTGTAGSHTLSLQVWDMSGNTFVSSQAVGPSGSQSVSFWYSTYSSHVNLAQIGAIQLHWVTDPTSSGGANVSFDWFGTAEVPEPGTIVLMGGLLALGLVVGMRRRLVAARQIAV